VCLFDGGTSVYSAADEAGSSGLRRPSETEIAIARFQGQHVAEITLRLLLGTAALAQRQ
jgi:NAD(P)H dehydrogenase (quinone)